MINNLRNYYIIQGGLVIKLTLSIFVITILSINFVVNDIEVNKSFNSLKALPLDIRCPACDFEIRFGQTIVTHPLEGNR